MKITDILTEKVIPNVVKRYLSPSTNTTQDIILDLYKQGKIQDQAKDPRFSPLYDKVRGYLNSIEDVASHWKIIAGVMDQARIILAYDTALIKTAQSDPAISKNIGAKFEFEKESDRDKLSSKIKSLLRRYIPSELSPHQSRAAIEWLTYQYLHGQFKLDDKTINYIKSLISSFYNKKDADIHSVNSIFQLKNIFDSAKKAQHRLSGTDTIGSELIVQNGKNVGSDFYLFSLSVSFRNTFVVTQERCNLYTKAYGFVFTSSSANRTLKNKGIQNGILCALVNSNNITETINICVDLADNTVWVGNRVLLLQQIGKEKDLSQIMDSSSLTIISSLQKEMVTTTIKKIEQLLENAEETSDYTLLLEYMKVPGRKVMRKQAKSTKKTVKENTMPSIFQTLLEAEEEFKSRLPTAPSLDDEPEDDEDDDDGNTDEFKSMAGDMGKGLYALSAYNYGNYFTPRSSNSAAEYEIESAAKNSPHTKNAVQKLLTVSANDISETRGLAFAILNDRNGAVFSFIVSPTGSVDSAKLLPANPAVLAQKGLIDIDQVSVLNKLQQAGDAYADAQISNDNWETGGDIDDATADAEAELMDVLQWRDTVETKSSAKTELSPEDQAYNDTERAKYAAWVAAQKEKASKKDTKPRAKR
jgi:hypothetical protein